MAVLPLITKTSVITLITPEMIHDIPYSERRIRPSIENGSSNMAYYNSIQVSDWANLQLMPCGVVINPKLNQGLFNCKIFCCE